MTDRQQAAASATERGFGITDPNHVFRPKIDSNRFRRKRFALMLDHIQRHLAGKARIRVLDIGGMRGHWLGSQDQWQHLPLEITMVNLGAAALDDPPYFIRGGDACALDYADNSFDLVHSNSVIEHVGGWKAMTAMAGEIRRLAPHYFVQTPNYWFPIEPHFRVPGFQWFPEDARARMLMRWKLGFRPRETDFGAAMENVQSVRLLTARQMRFLFPDGRLERERFFGLTKSLLMIR